MPQPANTSTHPTVLELTLDNEQLRYLKGAAQRRDTTLSAVAHAVIDTLVADDLLDPLLDDLSPAPRRPTGRPGKS